MLSLLVGRSQVTPPVSEGDLLKSIDPINGDSINAKPALPAEPAKKKEKAAGQTEITANTADFNNKTHIAIFSGAVVVKNPEFDLICDKLTAYLKHDEKPAPAAPGDKQKPATPAPQPEGAKKPKGGLEKAIAEMATEGGRVIITQEKVDPDGSIKRSVGKADKAEYDAIKGEVILRGSPEVKQGVNSHVAAEPGTIMIMSRDGNMRSNGRTKTVIQDTDKPEGAAAPRAERAPAN